MRVRRALSNVGEPLVHLGSILLLEHISVHIVLGLLHVSAVLSQESGEQLSLQLLVDVLLLQFGCSQNAVDLEGIYTCTSLVLVFVEDLEIVQDGNYLLATILHSLDNFAPKLRSVLQLLCLQTARSRHLGDLLV